MASSSTVRRFLALIFMFSGQFSRSINYLECEKKCSTGLSLDQKRALCLSASIGHPLGPALCSLAVRSASLNLKPEDAVRLCNGATSEQPVMCFKALDNSVRSKYGFALCAGPISSTLPSVCMKEIGSMKHPHIIKNETIKVNFCREIGLQENEAALECIKAVAAAGSVVIASVGEAMFPCQSALSGVGVAACINDLRLIALTEKSSSGGGTLTGLPHSTIISLCASEVKSEKSTTPASVPSANKSANRTALVQSLQSSVARCLVASADVTLLKAQSWLSQNQAQTNPQMLTQYLTPDQRAKLCEAAPGGDDLLSAGFEPVFCAAYALSKRKGPMGAAGAPAPDETVALCSGANSEAAIEPINCYTEIRAIAGMAKEDRVKLCAGAPSTGPAHCYRRAMTLLRATPPAHEDLPHLRAELCVGAESEDPAVCVSSAPHFLTTEEKVNLCAFTPLSQAQHPVLCLQVVEAALNSFRSAPRKVFGYFLSSLQQDEERNARSQLLAMCSFASSAQPLASGDCFRASASSSLSLSAAIRVCTNASSANVAQASGLCLTLASASLGRVALAEHPQALKILCEGAKATTQAQAIVSCASSLAVSLPSGLKLDLPAVAELCRHEEPGDGVLACIKAAAPPAGRSLSGSSLVSAESLKIVCGARSHRTNGECLLKLASYSPSQQLVITSEIAAIICGPMVGQGDSQTPWAVTKQYAHTLACLESLGTRAVTAAMARRCSSDVQTPSSVRVVYLHSLDESDSAPPSNKKIVAGKRFRLVLQLLDQYRNHITSEALSSSNGGGASKKGWSVSVSINENNPQGAVLWGTRSNSSIAGVVSLQSLAISQPGSLTLKVYVMLPPSLARRGGEKKQGVSGETNLHAEDIDDQGSWVKIPLQAFSVTVAEDPSMEGSNFCVFAFHAGVCPAHMSENDWLGVSSNHKVTAVIPVHNYLRLLACSHTLYVWNVTTHPDFGHHNDFMLEYKRGIDAVWTGIGLPNADMGFLERLGFGIETSTSSAPPTAKQLKRAYYRLSLIWHPDRWSGLQLYSTAAQGAFELISEAYAALSPSSVTTP